ncbi:ulp1 protease family, C-terminal catalytic domain-containing protein [Tanacetum coccineum]|uniref:Ulp1 protease family, C-terminal catalytic domain-containing protein n=1 Tax=Tanacetum coccineum TaxID=301880 RepID=A0ABQ5DQX9_9ASTR
MMYHPQTHIPLRSILGVLQKEKEKQVEKRAKGLSLLESEPKPKDKEVKKTAIKGKATTDEVMMTEYLFSMEGEELDFVFETKDRAATIRDYMQTLAPQLKVESNVIDTFSLILNHEHKMNSKGKITKYFFHTTMIKNLFSMHLEKVKHLRAKDVLNKKPTIIRPKCGTTENDTDCDIFLMMHMEHYNRETAKNWNLEFPTEKQGNTLDIIKMRVRLATKILSHEINIHREKISTEAQEFARRNTDKESRKKMIKEAIKTKKEKQGSERVQSAI